MANITTQADANGKGDTWRPASQIDLKSYQWTTIFCIPWYLITHKKISVQTKGSSFSPKLEHKTYTNSMDVPIVFVSVNSRRLLQSEH